MLVDHIRMHVQAQMDSLYGDTEKTELGHCTSKFHFQIKSWKTYWKNEHPGNELLLKNIYGLQNNCGSITKL